MSGVRLWLVGGKVLVTSAPPPGAKTGVVIVGKNQSGTERLSHVTGECPDCREKMIDCKCGGSG